MSEVSTIGLDFAKGAWRRWLRSREPPIGSLPEQSRLQSETLVFVALA